MEFTERELAIAKTAHAAFVAHARQAEDLKGLIPESPQLFDELPDGIRRAGCAAVAAVEEALEAERRSAFPV